MAEAAYVFSAVAWARIRAMAGDDFCAEHAGDDAAILLEAMRLHPLGCRCDHLACVESRGGGAEVEVRRP